jgi:hypothetical protein
MSRSSSKHKEQLSKSRCNLTTTSECCRGAGDEYGGRSSLLFASTNYNAARKRIRHRPAISIFNFAIAKPTNKSLATFVISKPVRLLLYCVLQARFLVVSLTYSRTRFFDLRLVLHHHGFRLAASNAASHHHLYISIAPLLDIRLQFNAHYVAATPIHWTV